MRVVNADQLRKAFQKACDDLTIAGRGAMIVPMACHIVANQPGLAEIIMKNLEDATPVGED